MADRAQHRWKVSTFVLLAALVAMVGARRIGAADAQMKSVPKPVAIQSQGGDKKKIPPAALATKLLEAAKTKVARMPSDATGRRARALQMIDLAVNEAKALGANEEPPAEGAAAPVPVP